MSSPPQPPEPDCIYYTVRSPWEWVLQEIAESSVVQMKQISIDKLPSGIQNATATPNTQRRRTILKKGPVPCTLRLELCDAKNSLLVALHGTSSALDGLEDKDELVRTMQRCRCEHLHIGPPSLLIKWDITRDELSNYIGGNDTLPVLSGAETSKMAVLKEPLSARGEGIYFIQSADEAYTHIERHRKQALSNPNLLDNIMNQKGRMPSWVLQAEVYPPVLIQGGRKFSIRSNIVVVENLGKDDLLDIYVYNRHEVRIAGAPVTTSSQNNDRDPLAHITNGADSDTTLRALLTDVPELSNKQDALEQFLSKALTSVLPDIKRRVGYSASQDYNNNSSVRKFVMAGVDSMMTAEGRFYLLEANVHPAAPPKHLIQQDFKHHLIGYMQDLIDLIRGKPSPNFGNIQTLVNGNQ